MIRNPFSSEQIVFLPVFPIGSRRPADSPATFGDFRDKDPYALLGNVQRCRYRIRHVFDQRFDHLFRSSFHHLYLNDRHRTIPPFFVCVQISSVYSVMRKEASPRPSIFTVTWSPAFTRAAPVTPPDRITCPFFKRSPLRANILASMAIEFAG